MGCEGQNSPSGCDFTGPPHFCISKRPWKEPWQVGQTACPFCRQEAEQLRTHQGEVMAESGPKGCPPPCVVLCYSKWFLSPPFLSSVPASASPPPHSEKKWSRSVEEKRMVGLECLHRYPPHFLIHFISLFLFQSRQKEVEKQQDQVRAASGRCPLLPKATASASLIDGPAWRSPLSLVLHVGFISGRIPAAAFLAHHAPAWPVLRT